MTALDLLVVPSINEGMGRVILEAGAGRTPVVAFAVGGIPEVVRHGENGYLLPVGDVDAMAEAALDLLRDEDKRREFGKNARRWALEQFEEGAVVAQYRALYEEVAAT